MIIIHQRKSAGSALIKGLADSFDLIRKPTRHKKNIFNCIGSELHQHISQFEPANSPIASFHLHPTKLNLDWMVSKEIRAVVLLRHPQSSYHALFRHRGNDNSFSQKNAAANNSHALEILEEFNRNWRSLVGSDNLLFITYEQVVLDYQNTLLQIQSFYPQLKLKGEPQKLPKVRYSGGHSNTSRYETDLSKTKNPTFRFTPDYSVSKDALRRVGYYNLTELYNKIRNQI